MQIEKFHKKDIGSKQLETALQLFFAGGDLFSVITLAGAAEEVLGQLLQQKNPKGAGGLKSLLALLRPGNRWGGQGAASRHEAELYVHMDLRQEALFLLGKAIDCYQALGGGLTAAMQRFNEEFRGGKG